MKKRRLGRSGLTVSLAGLGCNNFGARLDQDQTKEVVSAALDAGVTFFDTARSYGEGRSEEYLGFALEGRRDQAVVATKFGSAGIEDRGSRAELIRSLEKSLRALRTDYVDLLQLHFPDPRTPIAETLDALDALVRTGKVRYIGCSNFTGWMLADAHWTSSTRLVEPFVSVQNQWSLLHREVEVEVTAAAERFGLGVLPYFPLASGLLTGTVTRDTAPPTGSRLSDARFQSALTPANFDKVERLRAFAKERDWTLTRLALSWLASHRVVSSVIAGATSPAQVQENAASTLADLSAEEIGQVAGLVES
jgi:aryl-alcohol dehydrogenase-like predicted oxidoreductase